MNKKLITILMGMVLLSGCASMQDSILLGAGVAGAVGTGIGIAASDGSTGGTLLGAGIGLITGAAFGYLSYQDKLDKQNMLKALSKKNIGKEEFPVLRAPEASCTRIGASIEGNKYVGPHISCEIEKQAVWTR